MDQHVETKAGEVGRVVGSRRCTLEGCTGKRLGVRWPDGRLTWPCTKGMERLPSGDWWLP